MLQPGGSAEDEAEEDAARKRPRLAFFSSGCAGAILSNKWLNSWMLFHATRSRPRAISISLGGNSTSRADKISSLNARHFHPRRELSAF